MKNEAVELLLEAAAFKTPGKPKQKSSNLDDDDDDDSAYPGVHPEWDKLPETLAETWIGPEDLPASLVEVLLDFERVIRFDVASANHSDYLYGRLTELGKQLRATMATVVQLKMSIGENLEVAEKEQTLSIRKQLSVISEDLHKLDTSYTTLSNKVGTVKASFDLNKALLNDQFEKIQKILTVLVQFKTFASSRLRSMERYETQMEATNDKRDVLDTLFSSAKSDADPKASILDKRKRKMMSPKLDVTTQS